jgi:ribonuclease HII
VARGFLHIAGLDEAGRGAWAGPVVAAAVVLPLLRGRAAEVSLPEELIPVRDSKLLSPARREELFRAIQTTALAVGVGMVTAEEIDAQGIVPATRLAMRMALSGLNPAAQHLLIDYLLLPEVELPQKAMAHGDTFCYSIAAASIVAKVQRDHLMVELGARFPEYGFSQHKGYGTRAHRTALAQLGPSPIHRLSWAPCRGLSHEDWGVVGATRSERVV